MAPGPALPKKLRIGVMMEEIQAADIMGADVFASLGRLPDDMAAYVSTTLDPAMAEKAAKYQDDAVEIEWFYIATTLDPVRFYGSFKWVPNTTYANCPRDLDIVIQGGNLPTCRPAEADRFMKEAFPKTRFWLTTCTGAIWLASSGVLDGKQATTNRAWAAAAKLLHPKVEWVEQRWVVQEKPYEGGGGNSEVWTAAGAVAGFDMIAAFCLEKFNPDFVRDVALASLDYFPEQTPGQFYRK